MSAVEQRCFEDDMDFLSRCSVEHLRQSGSGSGPEAIDRARCLDEIRTHTAYLQQALYNNSPALFLDYTTWSRSIRHNHRLPVGMLVDQLSSLAACASACLPSDWTQAAEDYLTQALDRLNHPTQETMSYLDEDSPQHPLASAYLAALLEGRRHHACRLILEAISAGTPVSDIYLRVFQPCQREVGRLWQTNQINVGQEHYCSAATQWIMSQLYPYIFNAARCGRRLVAVCAGGELHEIGVRMVTDLFEMDGWDTFYLGADVPPSSVVAMLKAQRAEALGISATISTHIRQVRESIAAVRADPQTAATKILVGGHPFNIESRLWATIGADAYAQDAPRAVAAANRLVG